MIYFIQPDLAERMVGKEEPVDWAEESSIEMESSNTELPFLTNLSREKQWCEIKSIIRYIYQYNPPIILLYIK